jgi:prepilin-type N-terminal cleavage/methylation domain-containing protein
MMHTIRGFTLLETMVALAVLSMAIIAPISLVAESLLAAVYARDQVTAFYIAQEGIEAVRSMRDNNILQNAITGSSINILNGIPDTTGNPFTIDSVHNNAMAVCSGACPMLQTDGTLYGYGTGWSDTNFRRTLYAQYLTSSSTEVQLKVLVEWQTGNYKARSFQLSEDLYRWVNDGSAAR